MAKIKDAEAFAKIVCPYKKTEYFFMLDYLSDRSSKTQGRKFAYRLGL